MQNNPQLKQACIQAIINRNSGNDGHDDFSGHGWLHKALVFARLKNGSSLNDMLLRLFDSDIFYTSLMADHNTTGKFVYCTDFTLGFIGIVDEALIYSDESTLEFLPAIPSSWNKGSAGGFRTRCGIVVNELTWDLELEKIDCTVTDRKSVV